MEAAGSPFSHHLPKQTSVDGVVFDQQDANVFQIHALDCGRQWSRRMPASVSNSRILTPGTETRGRARKKRCRFDLAPSSKIRVRFIASIPNLDCQPAGVLVEYRYRISVTVDLTRVYFGSSTYDKDCYACVQARSPGPDVVDSVCLRQWHSLGASQF